MAISLQASESLARLGSPVCRSLKREQVDWSQSRIIFIAPEFTKYQQHAIGFKDVGIQLWEVH